MKNQKLFSLQKAVRGCAAMVDGLKPKTDGDARAQAAIIFATFRGMFLEAGVDAARNSMRPILIAFEESIRAAGLEMPQEAIELKAMIEMLDDASTAPASLRLALKGLKRALDGLSKA